MGTQVYNFLEYPSNLIDPNQVMSRLIRFLTALHLLLFAQAIQSALPLATPDGGELPSLAPMLQEVLPAVVNISTRSKVRTTANPLMQDPFFRRFFNLPQQSRPSSSLGSGVIVDAANGYVITNHHVIDKADEIIVTTKDGHKLDARLVGSDTASDVAIIQVAGDHLAEITLGVSEEMRVGDFVVAIGSPFGLSHTVTSGIVSALGRSGLGIEGYEDFIQTDASINPGNSGGALVNLRGELIGINTAILSRGGGSVGIGLSIPVDMVKSLMDQLLEHGEVKRGLLGVRMQDLTPPLASAIGIAGKKGALISEVIPDSAADEVGLREGDVIVLFNQSAVENSADLRNAVGLVRPGMEAEMEYYRDGVRESATVRIQAFKEAASPDSHVISRLHGAKFKNASPDGKTKQGVVVIGITAGSPAESTGLKENDIIVGINQQAVNNLDDMKRITASAADRLAITLTRNESTLLLVIQ